MSNLFLISSNKYLNFYKLVLFLFPFFLVSGPFLPDLTISILSLFFFLKIIRKVKNNFILKNLFTFFLFFYFYIIFNSFFSFDPIISFKASIPYLRFFLFAFLLALLLYQFRGLFKIILLSLIICYLILLVDSVFQVATGYNFLGSKINSERISSFFGDKLVMGSFVARTLPIALSIFFFTKFKYQDLLAISTVIVAGVLVYLSAERLAFFFFFCTVACFIYIQFIKKRGFNVLIIFFFLSIILYYIKPAPFDRLYSQTINQLKETDKFGFSYRHELHFITAYNLFNDSKLLGHGLKSFRNLCGNDKYGVAEKIIKDKTIYSQIDGKVFIDHKKNNGKNILFILQNNYSENKFLEILASNYSKDSFYIKKFDEGIYIYNFYKNFSKIYVKNNDIIRTGDPLGYNYDFPNGCNTHPHNYYFEFLSELGLIGFTFLLVSFFYLLFIFLKVLNTVFFKKNINVYFPLLFSLLGVIITLFPLFPSGSFFNNWLSSIFYFNLAFVLSFILINKKI